MLRHSQRGRLGTVLSILLAITILMPVRCSAELSVDEQKLLTQISVHRMMTTIQRLCSDQFAGRQAGSPEHYAAADYIAYTFKEMGLSEIPDLAGYKQQLFMRYSLVKSKDEIKATMSYKIGSSQKNKTFAYPGFVGRGGLNLNAPVVYVGYGISDPGSGYDDYQDLDVAGKIVLWRQGQPAGITLTKKATAAQKLTTAYQRGAIACLIDKPAGIKDEWGTNVGLSGSIADFPYIAIDDKIAADLMCKPRISNLKTGDIGTTVRLRVTPVCDPQRRTYNIVGMIPGIDPAVADQVVMVGAHYDHIGTTSRGEIFRGADDNASGTSVVLEVARALRSSGLKPRRTMVFASWTGEEGGLVGSSYFASHPPFPLEKIVSNLQLDMVGAGTPGKFMTTGASAFPAHYRFLDESGKDLGYEITPDVIQGASDHLSFARKKVPSSLIYSAGDHPNYHSIRDTPSRINKFSLDSAAKLTALAIWRAANE